MSLRQTNSNLVGIIAFVGLGLLGNMGCSGEAPLPAPETSAPAPASDSGLTAIGVATGTVRDGKLEISEVTPVDSGAPQVGVQNFGASFSQSKITFLTTAGGPGALGCTATQYCASINMTNGTGQEMDNSFVEITDYFQIVPAGTPISWAGAAFPLATSPAYTSVFVNPGNIQAANYGTLLSNATGTVLWKFNAGASTNFHFHIKIYASFPRTGFAGSLKTGAGAFAAVDACGAAAPTLFVSGDDGESQFNLPFAYTLGLKTYDKIAIGANGYVQLYSSTDAGPPAALSVTDQYPLVAGPVGLFPFWDDLGYAADGGVCTKTTGTRPNRIFSITWKNARVSTNQPAKPAVFAAEKFSFGIALYELNDFTEFYYPAPTTITTRTRGASSTCGWRGPPTMAKPVYATLCGFDSPWLGAAVGSYPESITWGQGGNP